MRFVAITHHGNFREEVAFNADSEKEFKEKCVTNVSYIAGNGINNSGLRKVWEGLLTTGIESYGWTDFIRVS